MNPQSDTCRTASSTNGFECLCLIDSSMFLSQNSLKYGWFIRALSFEAQQSSKNGSIRCFGCKKFPIEKKKVREKVLKVPSSSRIRIKRSRDRHAFRIRRFWSKNRGEGKEISGLKYTKISFWKSTFPRFCVSLLLSCSARMDSQLERAGLPLKVPDRTNQRQRSTQSWI